MSLAYNIYSVSFYMKFPTWVGFYLRYYKKPLETQYPFKCYIEGRIRIRNGLFGSGSGRQRFFLMEPIYQEFHLKRTLCKKYTWTIIIFLVSALTENSILQSSTKVRVFTELFPIERNFYLGAEDLCVKMREALACC
jgi:hypothetical protein